MRLYVGECYKDVVTFSSFSRVCFRLIVNLTRTIHEIDGISLDL